MANVDDSVRLENIRLEYSNISSRFGQYVERRDQIIGMTLTFASAIVGIAIAYPTNPSIALIYPPIATFLAISWTYTYILNIVMATYIRECIAPKMQGIGWESFLKKWRDQHQGTFRLFAVHSGVFVLTQLLAIFVGITIRPANQSLQLTSFGVVGLLVIDCLSVLITIYFLRTALYDRKIINVRT